MDSWSKIGGKQVGAVQIALTLIAFLLYTVLFYLLYPHMGGPVKALSILPVLAGSWLLGLKGGVAVAILSIVLNLLLFNLQGEAGWSLMIRGGGITGSLTVLLTGMGAGYARTLHIRHTEEIAARRRAEAGLQRRDRIHAALAYCAEQLLRNPNWQDALDTVLSRLGEAADAGRARVLQNVAGQSAATGVYYFAEWTAEGVVTTAGNVERINGELSRPYFQPILQQLAQGKIVSGRIDEFPQPLRDELAARGVHSTVVIPIFVASEWWGQLAFDDCTGHFPFEQLEQEAFSIAASLLGAAIHRQQAESHLLQRNRELQLLNRLIAAATSRMEPRVVLEIACRELAQAFDVPQVGAALLDDSGEVLEVVAQYVTGDAPSAIGQQILVADNPASQAVLREKEPLVIGDAQRDRRMAPHNDLMRRLNIASILLLPLQVNGVVVGTIGLDSRTLRDFSQEEVRLAATAAAAVGQVLDRARLYVATQTQARQMQQIVDSVPIGLLLLDEERRVLLPNSLAQTYLEQVGDYDQDGRLQAFGGKAVTHLLQSPPEERQFHEVQTGEPLQNIFEIRAATIEEAGWVLVLRDVTVERDQAARLQAQERLAVVGQLSAGIAHDFNNILGVIVIHAQLLQRESLPPPVQKRLDVIHDQAQRASQLVQQILDFSRKAVMRREALDLLPFLQEQVELLARTLPATIDVALQHDGGAFMVEADVTRLQQVMMNLAVNARDAMPHGGRLQFSLSLLAPAALPPLPGMPSGAWMRLDVSDDGAGIDPAHLAHIFEPFYTTKGPGKGSGLGLAQVYGIVRQHQGHIEVETAVDHGTTFTIYLPLLSLEPPPAPLRRPRQTATEGVALLAHSA